MAKLMAPLFSISAHGTVGGVLTYSKRKTANQVRFQQAQRDIETIPRSLQRIKFGASGGVWSNLTQEQKDELTELLNEG
jgi:hypothetical protein